MSSVYITASALLSSFLQRRTSLKSLIFAAEDEHSGGSSASTRKHYKLVAETLRCQPAAGTARLSSLSPPLPCPHCCLALRCAVLLLSSLPPDKAVLDEVIDVCGLSRLDRRLTRPLLLVQLYDLLFGAQRDIEGGGHWKRLILTHRTPIAAALARIYIRTGAAQPQQLLPHALRPRPPHPRYVRVNTLLTSLPDAIVALTAAPSSFTLLPAPTAAFPSASCFYVDADVPDLLVFAPGTAFYSHPLYLRHHLVLQDKASCLPALCLDPQPGDVVVDGCAAPGNKTSHLLAIMQERVEAAVEGGSISSSGGGRCSVDAFEVDNGRFGLLCEMMSRKGAEVGVDCSAGCHREQQEAPADAADGQRRRARVRCHHASFLSLRSSDSLGQRCSHLLLDPTCSGSGMMNGIEAHYRQQARDADREQKANDRKQSQRTATQHDNSVAPSPILARKRRRSQQGVEDDRGKEIKDEEKVAEQETDVEAEEAADSLQSSASSVSALADFQLSLLLHAFSLPALRRIVYSTCSTHTQENEQVIARALAQRGRLQGWEVQTGLMPAWRRRGRLLDSLTADEAQAMIRCDADEDRTNGFFVCGLIKRGNSSAAEDRSSAGQRTAAEQAAQAVEDTGMQKSSSKKKKKNRKKRKNNAAQQPAVDARSAAAQ